MTVRMTGAELIATARGIVTGELMVADLRDRDWHTSLALLLSGVEDRGGTIGLVLVPRGPHLRGYWLNGQVPAVSFEAKCVHVNDVRALSDLVDTMNSALYPETERNHDERPTSEA